MYIKEITKETVFVKRVGNAYLVDEKEVDGIKTIRTTKNPLKAQTFTAENIYPLVYNNLTEREVERITKAHEETDAYGLLSRYVAEQYDIVSTVELGYGYNKDAEAEKKLLTELKMDYVFMPVKVNVESIDPVIIKEEE